MGGLRKSIISMGQGGVCGCVCGAEEDGVARRGRVRCCESRLTNGRDAAESEMGLQC